MECWLYKERHHPSRQGPQGPGSVHPEGRRVVLPNHCCRHYPRYTTVDALRNEQFHHLPGQARSRMPNSRLGRVHSHRFEVIQNVLGTFNCSECANRIASNDGTLNFPTSHTESPLAGSDRLLIAQILSSTKAPPCIEYHPAYR